MTTRSLHFPDYAPELPVITWNSDSNVIALTSWGEIDVPVWFCFASLTNRPLVVLRRLAV